MGIEARFTLPELNTEIQFTVVEISEQELYLFSNHDEKEYRFRLNNENGLLRLTDGNPFVENESIVEERLTGLSADWVEARSQGFENSTDFAEGNQPGYGPDDIFVENKPFSLRQIVDLIHNEDIELTPNFQRNFIWDKTRQSRLIESIFLGLPLPSIYLSQYEDGKLTVVDGLQRLSTIKEFFDNNLELSNLEYLTECNKLKYSELESILSPLRLRRFGQTQVMCFVIDYRSPSKLKFDLFRRLNTGGKPLNNQEIRNCLSRPELQGVLSQMVSSTAFRNATSNSVKDIRMEAQEAALRFIYFYELYQISGGVGSYNGYMESTLDDFIEVLNKKSREELECYIPIYENSLMIAYHLFGSYCFRKVTIETIDGRRAPVNKLLMLSFSILFTKYNYPDILSKYKENILIKPLAELIEDFDVFRAITWSTNAKWNIDFAITKFNLFLESQLC